MNMDWISVKDSLPAPGTKALIVWKSRSGNMEVAMGYKTESAWYLAGSRIRSVTHWMPVPQPPEEET